MSDARRRPESETDPDRATAVPDPAAAPLHPQPHGGAIRQGNPGNRGGGRKPEWFRAEARTLIEQYNLLPRLAAIGAGLIGEIKVVKDPEGNALEVFCATPVKEQVKAIETLAKLGIGFQTAHTDGNGGPLAVFVAAATGADGRPLVAGSVEPLQGPAPELEAGE